MHALIVHAHPEPGSFTAALMHAAADTLQARGAIVELSDLYPMRFDPVSDRRNFRTTFDAARLRLQSEEAHAARHGGFVPALQAEMDKLARCTLLLLVFPVWWLGLPAMLKGWVDRVFAAGVAYGGERSFELGPMRGKRALCVVTTGGREAAYAEASSYAPIETVMYPVRRGVLEFTGFEVLPTFAVHAPHRIDPSARAAALDALRARLLALPDDTTPFPQPPRQEHR